MSKNQFKRRSESELARMSDEDLLAYARDARASGDMDAAKLAMGILVWRYKDQAYARVLAKVDRNDAEEVLSEILISAMGSALDSVLPVVFRAWLNQITGRRIADHHRRKEGKPTLGALPSEHLGEDEVWGDEPSEEFEGESAHARQCLERTYEARSPEHREVLDRHVFGRASAKQTADGIPGMTEDNVNQIASRFRRDFNDCLGGADS